MDADYLSKEEGEFLLKIARKSIKHYIEKGSIIEIKPSEVPSKRLINDGAAFVTLYKGKDKELRGCIGSLSASRPLVYDVADNAIHSAFEDPRFYPLTKAELADIRIEISVLTPAKRIDVKTKEEVLHALVPGKHGLIIRKGYNRATFLPVVWEQLKTKEEFLSHLCMKAGLAPEEWKDAANMEFQIYEAQLFEEE